MRSVLEEALASAVGALEPVRGPRGTTLLRAPAQALARLRDPALDHVAAVPSGVRLEALTDAPFLELVVDVLHVVVPGEEHGCSFDVAVDGVLQEPTTPLTAGGVVVVDPRTRALDVQPSAPCVVRLDLGQGQHERQVELWLPQRSALSLVDVRVPDGCSLRAARRPGLVWVHHGSSISQAGGADRPTGTWPAIVARAAGLSLVNLGLGGQCHLDGFMARALRDVEADLVSLELGINVAGGDTMRERVFVSAVHAFLDTVREGHPTTPLLVVSPIHCPWLEEGHGPSTYDWESKTVSGLPRPAELAEGTLTLVRTRELLARAVEDRRAEGDRALHLLDGLQLLGTADVDLLPDQLHPDAAGYRLMAERFLTAALGEGGPFQARTSPLSGQPSTSPG